MDEIIKQVYVMGVSNAGAFKQIAANNPEIPIEFSYRKSTNDYRITVTTEEVTQRYLFWAWKSEAAKREINPNAK